MILLLTLAGFKETIKACCGAGGKYNVQQVLCGTSGYVNGVLLTTTTCADPNSYFSWDGVHSTEAVYRIMAESLLKGNYLEPSYALSKLCKLNFDKFQIGWLGDLVSNEVQAGRNKHWLLLVNAWMKSLFANMLVLSPLGGWILSWVTEIMLRVLLYILRLHKINHEKF